MMDVAAFYKVLRDVNVSRTQTLVQYYLQKDIPASQILNDGLIGAMNIVGREFKAKELWVPDVLLAARNMHSGIAILKSTLQQSKFSSKGTFIIGTVFGDIHDIGKNIVAILMEGSGFTVIDLGVNVSAETFVAAVNNHKPAVVGLSALLTTTMLEMGNIISAIRKNESSAVPKIIVGGAPVTKKFAEEIGADGYGEDAMSGVELALAFVGK